MSHIRLFKWVFLWLISSHYYTVHFDRLPSRYNKSFYHESRRTHAFSLSKFQITHINTVLTSINKLSHAKGPRCIGDKCNGLAIIQRSRGKPTRQTVNKFLLPSRQRSDRVTYSRSNMLIGNNDKIKCDADKQGGDRRIFIFSRYNEFETMTYRAEWDVPSRLCLIDAPNKAWQMRDSEFWIRRGRSSRSMFQWRLVWESSRGVFEWILCEEIRWFASIDAKLQRVGCF